MLLFSCEFFKPGEPVEFTTIAKDYEHIEYSHRANLIFQSDSAWRDFWLQNTKDSTFAHLIIIDFTDSTLICVFMGWCGSTGYSTTVEEVRQFEDRLEVCIREKNVGFGYDVITYPNYFVTIAKTTLPINFEYREKSD